MAKRLDDRPFRPEIPDEISNSEKARRLADALARIYDELDYVLFALGVENFNESGLRALKEALKVPRCFTSIPEGDKIAEGSLIIYDGTIYRAAVTLAKDGAHPPLWSSDEWGVAD